MNNLKEAEQAIAGLSPAEKAQLLEQLIRDLQTQPDAFPGIEMTPGVVGGAACIRQTRIAVWMLEEARRVGISDAELLHNYPGLTAQDLANAWNYVRVHQAEIDEQIKLNENDDDESQNA
ncbi:MAG: DUF433 domain-containing protein [Pyrinomonadaceae bacterium]|nr:DUF433 domain-containing protein [Pyrinomonadaceae bacterium]